MLISKIEALELLKKTMSNSMEEGKMDLNGKNIIYIGGFGGIGLETCKELAQKGVAVGGSIKLQHLKKLQQK